MAVFDGKTKTPCTIQLGQDHWKPQMGSLNKSCPPTEYAVIHGDRELVIHGNLTATTFKNRTHFTRQNYRCTVKGQRVLIEMQDFKHETMGKELRNVYGAVIRNFAQPVTETYLGELTQTHLRSRNINDLSNWLECISSVCRQINVDFNATVANITMTLADIYVRATAVGGTGVCTEKTLMELNKKECQVNINVVYTKIVSVNLHVTPLFVVSGMTASTMKFAINSRIM